MSFVLPADLQRFLSTRAQPTGSSVEDVLLELLYEAKARDDRRQVEQAKLTGTDPWARLFQEATAKQAWEKRHQGDGA